ncbi:MAG TPA: epoxide hydrolase [Anaerolineales bacterium]|jgi:pimeloyl-ACP methyl ester carboxylesterase|nr:epoxide hydrolase [Anaerolineales bacterium]
MQIEPFQISIPQETLDDLQERLKRTRWPDEVEQSGWRYGANLGYMKELTNYWFTKFDWREQEKRINSFANHQAVVGDLRVHFIHERGKGPNPIPLLITHGWPSSFVEMLDIIPMLTDPASHGGKASDSFDVIVPSVPGYGFSERPLQAGMTRWRVAEIFAQLMDGLGYPKFGLQANDIGAVISGWLAIDHPDRVIGLHTMMPTFPPPAFDETQPPMNDAEKAFQALVNAWDQDEGAYNAIQSTRPQTLGYGLNDSPVGLLAWIVEKWRVWTDPNGNIEDYFSKDELLTNVMIYWITETANSANRSYYERAHDARTLSPNDKIRVPTGMALTTEAVERAPREWVERRYADIRRWTEFSSGGHFLAAENPEMLAVEIREFFRQFR